MKMRCLSFLLVLLGISLPAAAQSPDPPRFLLESIVVEGVQRDAVREIVAAESLLKPGREYTEQELREAVYRIKRLPFVVDAEFSLRKGSERGSYQLVVTVEETRLVFYSAHVGGVYDGDNLRVGPGEDRVDWGASATAGGRWFVGSQGLVFGSVEGFDTVGPASAQVGYTRYNLFGRGGFASIALATDVSDENSGEAYGSSLSLGIPIVGNHSLRADLSWFQRKDEFFGTTFRNEGENLGLSWIYDTTDDPLFPTSGTRLTSEARYSRLEEAVQGPFPGNDFSQEAIGLEVVGRRHWALTHRQSVFAELSGSWSESDLFDREETFEQRAAGAGLGHSMDLWGFEKTERIGDLRWENTLQISSYETGFQDRLRYTDGSLTTSLVFRNAWGVLRGSFSYVDTLEEGQ